MVNRKKHAPPPLYADGPEFTLPSEKAKNYLQTFQEQLTVCFHLLIFIIFFSCLIFFFQTQLVWQRLN